MNSFVIPSMSASVFLLSVGNLLSPTAKVYSDHPKVAATPP
ncbi:MAG TPA: hypothetical protein VND64_28890 [Pirellulales bacterium]|nr:hypothetical protein [Pirellulales bacterium]